MRSPGGLSMFLTRPWYGVQRPRRWLPRGEMWFYLQCRDSWLLMLNWPFAGCSTKGLYLLDGSEFVEVATCPDLRNAKMKKISVGLEAGKTLPPLSVDSVTLKRFPLLRFFLTATTYEGGEPRAPGRLWLDNDGLAFRVTLFEPTAFAKAVLRANTLDDVFIVLEAFLAADSPPWMAAEYARERFAEKKSKKK